MLKTEIWLKDTQISEYKQGYVRAMESYKKKLSKARAQSSRVTEDTQRVMDAQQVRRRALIACVSLVIDALFARISSMNCERRCIAGRRNVKLYAWSVDTQVRPVPPIYLPIPLSPLLY